MAECQSCQYPSADSLLVLPPEVLLDIIHLLRPAKKDWDALRCSCRVQRELVGSCITRAVITHGMKRLGFPKHGLMRQLLMEGGPGAWLFGGEQDVKCTLGALQLHPGAAACIEAVELHVSGSCYEAVLVANLGEVPWNTAGVLYR